MRDFHAVLGRLCFAVGASDYLRPFTSGYHVYGEVAFGQFPAAVHCGQCRRGGEGLCGDAARGTPGTCLFGGRKDRRSACLCWRLGMFWGVPPGGKHGGSRWS